MIKSTPCKTASLPAVAILATVVLAGCAAGPDYVRPAPPTVQRYTAEALPEVTAAAPVPGGVAQHMVHAGQGEPRWWRAFGSRELDAMIEAALAANPDVQAMQAALWSARENAAAQGGLYYPTADLQVAPARQRVGDPLASPAASGASLYTLHTAQLNIAYAPDVFGAVRRQVEAAAAQADAASFQLEAARQALAANVAAAAIGEAALRAQLDAMQAQAGLVRRQLDAARQQQRAGQLSALDVAAQEGGLAQAEAALSPLQKQCAQQRHLLATLAGRMPSDGPGVQLDFDRLALPETLLLGVPAQLVARRPDIRAAEAQLHAASAQVGIATAARLPNIALTASLGRTALNPGTLFKSGAGFWSIGADLVQPLFRGGTLLHQQRAAEALYQQAAAQYQSVVLAAFQNVADSLLAIETDARALHAALDAEQAARRSAEMVRRQWQLGAAAYPAVLQAQQAHQQAVAGLIQARAARYADTVALFLALGGDWTEAGQ